MRAANGRHQLDPAITARVQALAVEYTLEHCIELLDESRDGAGVLIALAHGAVHGRYSVHSARQRRYARMKKAAQVAA